MIFLPLFFDIIFKDINFIQLKSKNIFTLLKSNNTFINVFIVKKFLGGLFFCFFCISNINSQEVHFSQLSQNQTNINPAFSGIMFGPRINLQFRNQYPTIATGVNSGYNTYFASYDQHFHAINSGFGFQVLGDKLADNILSRYSFELMYSYQVKFNRYKALRIGFSGNLNLQQIDFSQLRFYDQIDPILGFNTNNASAEDLSNNYNRSYFNTNVGLVYFTSDYYIGLSAKNLLPKKNFFNDEYAPFHYTMLSIQLGAVKRFGLDKEYALFPFLEYDRQGSNQKIVGNLLGQYKIYNLGVGFRHNFEGLESIMLMTGINLNRFRISYSYDIGTNTLRLYGGGSHEIGIRVLIGGENNSLTPNEHKEILECPDFLKN